MNTLLRERDRALARGRAALQMLFVADALAMPVHWYYNRHDIEKAFPGGIQKLEAAPSYHPSSIMALHSTTAGGRGAQGAVGTRREVVGDVILKGKRRYWGQQNQHYHQQMRAGENTLNAHCSRVLMRAMIAAGGRYHQDVFLEEYIRFMTSDVPMHPDTYAESYHRAFFANLENGRPKERCGGVTHDTPSIGGLVTIAPIAIAERLAGSPLDEVAKLCRAHLLLTHPDETLAAVCDAYVGLIDGLLFRADHEPAAAFLARTAQTTLGLDLFALAAKARSDSDVVGGRFSTACYISGSWPSVLYLAFKYMDQPRQALLTNANLGGDNAHRGAVLGVLLGLAGGHGVDDFFDQLVDRQAIDAEISALLKVPVSPQLTNDH